MPVRKNVIDAIGHTPLIKFATCFEGDRLRNLRQGRIHESRRIGQGPRGAGDHPGCRSRAARLKPGGIIVEGTAGNTGIGLALVANALGYQTVIVIPETQSQEKKDMLRLQGAELIEVPAVPYSEPEQLREALRPARRAARQEHPQGAIWANQFDNVANRQGHIDDDRPGDLGRDRRQDRRLRLRRRHRRHARRRRAWR